MSQTARTAAGDLAAGRSAMLRCRAPSNPLILMIRRFGDRWPEIHPTAFVEDSAQVIGAVAIGAGASVWFGAVVRGDIQTIAIGAGSNVQDGAVLHVTAASPVWIEDEVTLGHR